ncbi:LysM domain receptor-like kinase 3-like protein [Drosera capensis]
MSLCLPSLPLCHYTPSQTPHTHTLTLCSLRHHFSISPPKPQIMDYLSTLITLLFFIIPIPKSWSTATNPMNCTDNPRICSSFLAFQPNTSNTTTPITLPLILSMFDVVQDDVTVENEDLGVYFIRKNCSCDPKLKGYLTSTTYTVRDDRGGGGGGGGGGFVEDVVGEVYNGLAYLDEGMKWKRGKRRVRVGEVVGVRLLCGCSSGLWNYLMSDVMRDVDSVASLASRFGVSMDSIEEVNGISDPGNFSVGRLYYVPLDSVPGDPYPVISGSPPAPAPISIINTSTEVEVGRPAHLPYGWILGIAGSVLGLLVMAVLACLCLSSSGRSTQERRIHAKGPDGSGNHKFQILRSASSCCTSGRNICGGSSDTRQLNGETNEQKNIPKGISPNFLLQIFISHLLLVPSFDEDCQTARLLVDGSMSNYFNFGLLSVIGTDVFELEKPVVFTYEEIMTATEGFSEANLLGHGTYGSVYYGLLRDQEVAIKRMTATKSKEFTVEMKVLCRVHHANLVELIGYAASTDELFIIYEYAQKGSLRSHLHDPQNKGQTSLSWIMRVQIALDAARGLEYLHEHSKAHYVHRDIKTSNILLDAAFRAKISDFGLSKLIGKTSEADVSTTRVVGTYGYLAPEYLSEGLATTKSDVYAFGVVLFELISGREAVIRTEGLTKNSERRSLVSIMLVAMRNVPDSMSMVNMKGHLDPNLMDLYPHDCVYKMAVLAKQCVDADSILRPDMKQLVISLSQILLSSVEWEATLAGNSQVFSGLVQGR